MSKLEKIRDVELRKAQVEVQLEERRLALLAYIEFMADYRKRTGHKHPILPDKLPLAPWQGTGDPES